MNIKRVAKRALLPLKQHYERRLHELRYIFFELTHRCNLACIHCGSDCQKNDTLPDLPADKILETLDGIKTKHDSHKVMIVLSGGEPTIYPGVWDLGKEIIKREFPWGMVTNGYAWDTDMIKKAKEARMHSVTVSLDGLEETHNWLRGDKKSFRKAVNAIDLLLKNPFYRVMDVITCVNKRNIGELDKIYDLVKSMGLKRWRFFTISPIGRAVQTPDLFLDKEDFHYLMQKILAYRKKPGMKVTYSESGYLGCYEHRVRGHDWFCRAGVNVAGIMVNGDILACPNIDRRFKQGNIFETPFIDVWEHGYKEFRDRKWMRTGDCVKCSEWRLCQGNPMHLWDLDTNRTKLCHLKQFELDKPLTITKSK